MSSEAINFNWSCKHTWKRSAKNTAWCLLGCAIGDFGTILFFQLTKIPFPVLGIMTLAIINGLITSIILETIILLRQNLDFSKAFKDCIRYEFYINGQYGNSHEPYRCNFNRWSYFKLVGSSNNAFSWFFNSMAIQLLEIKKI